MIAIESRAVCCWGYSYLTATNTHLQPDIPADFEPIKDIACPWTSCPPM